MRIVPGLAIMRTVSGFGVAGGALREFPEYKRYGH
jgi:hypothetical protein